MFGALAYRFDNRFVLSLALSTLAGYLGLKIAIFDTLHNDRVRFVAVLFGAFLIGIGLLLNRQSIKTHFLDVYLQLGANAILLADHVRRPRAGASAWPISRLLLILSAAAIYLGVRYRPFRVRRLRHAVWLCRPQRAAARRDRQCRPSRLIYFVVTGSIVVIALVVLARRFGRDE